MPQGLLRMGLRSAIIGTPRCRRRESICLLAFAGQVLVHEGDGHAAFAHRRHALDRAQPHVATGEDARQAGLGQEGVAGVRPAAGLSSTPSPVSR